MNLAVRIVAPIVVIGAGVAVFMALVSTKPEASRHVRGPKPPLVEFLTVSPATRPARVVAQGQVQAARSVMLQPEVAGRVVWVSPELAPGGRFAAGEPILRIDRANYEAAASEAKAKLASAELALELERGRARVAEREWKLVGKDDAEGKDLALRRPHLAQAETAATAAKSALERAELDLGRTTLRAPFAALVLERSADLGQVVSPQSKVVTLAGTEAYWVQVALPTQQVGALEAGRSKAVVHQPGPGDGHRREGHVVRILGELDPVGRMARAIVEIASPLDEPALLLGSFVEVEIEGAPFEESFEIPEEALRGRSSVWLLGPGDRLSIREVDIAWRTRSSVIIAGGLAPGDRVITTVLAAPVDGMSLRTKSSTAAEGRPGPGKRS